MKKIMLILIVCIGTGAAVWVFSTNRVAEGVKPFNTTAENIAVKGFDTVAYFTTDAAIGGNPDYAFAWNGAKWLFSSAENLEKFKTNPEAFAPQFGGYCAYAVAHGYTANADPTAWKISGGKLYLNYDADVKKMWEKEETNFIAQGETNWRDFQQKKPEHKGN